MELQQLRYFLDIAQTQNMTASAKRMNVAQPALSHSMKKLEAELGCRLFDRVGRNIRLSRTGEYLAGQLRPVMTQLDDVPARVSAFAHGEEQVVDVGMYSASSLVVDAIAEYRETHPQAKFRISQEKGEGACDVTVRTVGVALGAADTARLADERVFGERIGLAVPASMATSDVMSLEQVRDEQFVLLAGSKGFRHVCDGLCAARGFVMRNAIESDSPAAVRRLIGLGIGVGFWPECSWGELGGGKAHFVPLDDDGFVRSIAVGTTADGTSASPARDFFEFLAAFVERTFRRGPSGL